MTNHQVSTSNPCHSTCFRYEIHWNCNVLHCIALHTVRCFTIGDCCGTESHENYPPVSLANFFIQTCEYTGIKLLFRMNEETLLWSTSLCTHTDFMLPGYLFGHHCAFKHNLICKAPFQSLISNLSFDTNIRCSRVRDVFIPFCSASRAAVCCSCRELNIFSHWKVSTVSKCNEKIEICDYRI